jgi:hypothetical protein
MSLVPTVAMTNYRIGDAMHRRLRGYKDAPVAEVRRLVADQLASLVDSWMTSNGTGLRRQFDSTWDVVATVPSSRRPVSAPVDAVISRVPQLDRLHRSLLVRGPAPIDHLVAARHGFEVNPRIEQCWLRQRRVLVFDDSIVTGARAQSAAAALRLGGARAVGVLAIGRVVAPGHPGEGAVAQAAEVVVPPIGQRSATRDSDCARASKEWARVESMISSALVRC